MTLPDLHSILGNYESFVADVLAQMASHGIHIEGRKLSHLGLRTATVGEYVHFRDFLKPLCNGYVENEHNGRPISKLDLAEPLELPHGFTVTLIELMPPKPDKDYPTGLEHLGVVVGSELESFAHEHASVLTGRQDQGPYCQPFYITFSNGNRVKFYDIGLKEVVEKEGGVFRKG